MFLGFLPRPPLLACMLLCLLKTAPAQSLPEVIEHGTYVVRMLLHPIGREEYTITQSPDGELELHTTTTVSDRGTTRRTSTTLELSPTLAPLRLQSNTLPPSPGGPALTQVAGSITTVREGETSRTFSTPSLGFPTLANTPAALEMLMMRFWKAHHQPASLPVLRASDRALPVEIRMVGHDAFLSNGRMVRLTRYTVANLVFGREVLWMNDSNRLAAVMTFAGGLPQEIVLDQYARLMGELYHSGVRQEELDLADLTHQVPPAAQGTFAITGVRLVDATGAPPIEHATVLVRNGLIAAAGPADSTRIPAGTRVIHAEGQTLLPGLWEMHSHYSGVEFGPALLAAGVTTARDCGGEMEFLTAVRRDIDQMHMLGPRLLLAGLIDSGGPLAFGSVDAETPAQGAAAVDAYADARFDQIKVYTQIQSAVLAAIANEAHARGMTVTGHVPAAVTTEQGIADGMDQINHLQFITRAMRTDGGEGPVDVHSPASLSLLQLLAERHIVVDPTVGWAEMAGHPRGLELADFEPGIPAVPYTLAQKFEALGVPAADAERFRQRMQTNLEVLHGLIQAGVPIVAGSDTGLIGYGLDRELELYVQAGMTPMQAIQSATIVPARAMKHERDSGTVEVGKRADLVLIQGNPLESISNLRKVVSVVTAGRFYESRKLGLSVGFHR